jgi:hypothetical protein
MLKVLAAAGTMAAALSLLFVIAAGSGSPASATVPQTCAGHPLTHPAVPFFGFGSTADDRMAGIIGFGTQIINGLQGQDCIDGADGVDLLIGGTDDDELYGGSGEGDILIGGQGNDRLDGGTGDEDLLIGAGTASAASDIDVNLNPDGTDFCVNVDFPFGPGGAYIVNYTGEC